MSFGCALIDPQRGRDELRRRRPLRCTAPHSAPGAQLGSGDAHTPYSIMAPPPERHNADSASCGHCGRFRSRKWLVASNGENEIRSWFCAGEKAKYGCRSKAKALGATVWQDPGFVNFDVPSAMRSLDSRALTTSNQAASQCKPATSFTSTTIPGIVDSVSLSALIKIAWQRNDALMMSQALLKAHQSGHTLTTALGASLNASPPPDTPLSVISSRMPQEFLQQFGDESHPSLICLKAHEKHGYVWAANATMKAQFAASDGISDDVSAISAVFTSFIHPEDVFAGYSIHQQVVHELASAPPGSIRSVYLPPARMARPCDLLFSGFVAEMKVRLDPGCMADAYAEILTWRPMPDADVRRTWDESELVRGKHLPHLRIEEPAENPCHQAYNPLRFRLLAPTKRAREGSPLSPTGLGELAGSEAESAALSDDSAGASSCSTGSPRSPVDAVTGSTSSRQRGDDSAALLWSVDDVVELLVAQ
eukprot:6213690-Pleurochrysis_carterae.AAC.2